MGAGIEINNDASLYADDALSHPTMGAWIEIELENQLALQKECRTPRWVRGLKFEEMCMATRDL